MVIRGSSFVRRSMSVSAAIGLVCASAASAWAQGADRRSVTGKDVAIYNLVGSVHAEAGSGSGVGVEITRHGRDAAKLRIESGEIRGKETVRVVYPDRRVVFAGIGDHRGWYGRGSRTTLDVSDDGTFGDNQKWGGRRVEIVGSGDGLDAYADVKVSVPKGQRITLHLGAGDATVTNVDGDVRVDVAAASVTANGVRGHLSLDTGSGSVSVTDVDGDVDLDSGSGEVTLTRIKGDVLRVDSGSGRVRVQGIDVERLDLDSGSGSVRLSDVKSPEIVLDSGSGSVELDLVADVETLKIDAGSGSVTISAPKSLGAELVAETGSGGIRVDLPIEVKRREHGFLSGKIGDGKGKILIDSGSGGVTIRER